MPYYKSPNGAVHILEDAAFVDLLPPGSLPITQQEAEELNPPPVPPVPSQVTMRQARLALLAAGVLAGVDAFLDSLPSPQKEAARIEWEYAATVDRESALVQSLAGALDLDSAELDALFTAAAAL